MAITSNARPLPNTVKETVDFAYEMLIPHQDGVVFTTSSLGFNEQRIFSTLVKRGIITKTPVARNEGRGCNYRYKWAAQMGPTKVLYGSIVDEIRDHDRAKAEKKEKKKEEVCVETEVRESLVEEPKKECAVRLVEFSSQELWDELKARGYVIEGENLVKKDYLN